MVTKTDGVPLFVEELTKLVLESGFLREEAERYTLTGPLPALAIPATLARLAHGPPGSPGDASKWWPRWALPWGGRLPTTCCRP